MHMPVGDVRPIYLSPHLDDAALSCGGFIHQQAQHGLRPLVITCFAGVPDYRSLSPFAQEQHLRWGDALDPVEQRRREDAAVRPLGAEVLQWDYLDCIYRQAPDGAFLYTSEQAIFGAPHGAERGLPDELAARVSRVALPAAGVFAPLAVGNHVDHQIVRQAALRLRGMGLAVEFYEDYPYAETPDKLATALRGWATPPTERLVPLAPEDLEAKIHAIQGYRSQLQTLFGDETQVGTRVTAYARAVGGGHGPVERYWQGGVR